MVCSDSSAVLSAETVKILASLSSGRRASHHLSMRMIANSLFSVDTPRAGVVWGRRGRAGSKEDTIAFQGLTSLRFEHARFFVVFFVVWRWCDGSALSSYQYVKRHLGTCGHVDMWTNRSLNLRV